MNASRFPHSNDPSFTTARRAAALARAFVASGMVLGILAAAVTTACSPGLSGGPVANDAVSETPAHNPAGPAGAVEQMELDPAEIREYSMNAHG